MEDRGASEGNAGRQPSPAVVRAIRILEYLAHENPEAGLSDIATRLNLNKSTCFNILKALRQSNVVVRDARFPVYRLGPKLIELGTASRRNYSYRTQVKREVGPLVAKYELACLIAQVLPGDAGIFVLDRVTPPTEHVLAAPVGHVYPMSAPAMGRAALAARPVEEVVGMQEVQSLPGHGDLADLLTDLENVRERGYATSHEEYTPGVNAVASAVLGPDGDVALILCLLGSKDRFPPDRMDAAGVELRGVTDRLALALYQSFNGTPPGSD
jgi:DNA-binding IclR family transcriptional regulator